jgi:hypothetical protein
MVWFVPGGEREDFSMRQNGAWRRNARRLSSKCGRKNVIMGTNHEWTTLTGKLEMCKASLTRWSKGKNENIEKEIANKCKLLEELQEKEGLTNRPRCSNSNVKLIYSLSKRTSTGDNVQENRG